MNGEWQHRCRACCSRNVYDARRRAVCRDCGWEQRYDRWVEGFYDACAVFVCEPAGPEYMEHPPWWYSLQACPRRLGYWKPAMPKAERQLFPKRKRQVQSVKPDTKAENLNLFGER